MKIVDFNIGDFVEFRGARWIVINVDTDTCDLMNGYQEEKWNVYKKDLTLIAKHR